MGKKEGFSGKIGFILTAAGAAVGLGNIWRFPYLAAKYGGGIFLLVYLLLTLTFGFAIMVAEVAIGRRTSKSASVAFGALDKRFSFLGYMCTAAPVLIFPYYCVVGGWVLRYAVGYLLGGSASIGADGFYDSFVSSSGVVSAFFLIFLLVSAFMVLMGVQSGVERLSKIIMPLLLIVVIALTVYVLVAVNGARAALSFYFSIDFSKLSVMTFVVALGQLFYSMSISMGTMVTFGSYMSRDVSIEKSVHSIEIFDTGVAFISGLLVISAVFAFSGTSVLDEGAPLMFLTLPKVFASIPYGGIVGAVFFVMVFFAALTSSVALMETVVSSVTATLRLRRSAAVAGVVFLSLLLGIPSALGYGVWNGVRIMGFGILDFFDFITNNILMPLTALITAIFVGYVITPTPLIEEVGRTGRFKSRRLFAVMIKYVAPVFIVVILASSLLSVFGLISI